MQGKLAVEAANSLLTRLKDRQKTEDEALMLMDSWRYQEVIPVINRQKVNLKQFYDITDIVVMQWWWRRRRWQGWWCPWQ